MFCEECGSRLPEGAKFCENCGARVAGSNAQAPPSSRPAGQGPRQYYPDPERYKRYVSLKDRWAEQSQIDNDPFED